MKIFYFLNALIFFSFNSLYAQPNLDWENNWAGPIYNDEGKLIEVDGDGNVYIAGVSDSENLKDWIIIKYDPDGQILWTQRVNGTSNKDDEPQDMKIDNQGNIYVTGYVTDQNPTTDSKDMCTIKISPNGTILWTKIDESVWYGLKLLIDVYGNVFVAGGFLNSYSYSVIYKYNSNGDLLWGKTIFGGNNNLPLTIKQMEFNAFGNLVLLKQYYGNDHPDLVELSAQDGSIIFEYNWEYGIAKSMIIDEVSGDIYVLSQRTSWLWFIYLFRYHEEYSEDFIEVNNSSNDRIAIDFKMDKFKRLYILEYWPELGEPSIWKYDQNGSSGWFSWYDLIAGNNDFTSSMALYIDEDEDEPDILVTGNTSIGNILTFNVSNYNSEVIWEETYDCGNNKPDISNYLYVDECDNIYITGLSSCGNTYKDVKTIKYSTLELPAIEVSGDLPLCYGDEITISVPSCQDCTYSWSSGQTSNSITVSPENTTYYTVTVTNSEDCPVISDTLEVIVNPLHTPEISIESDKNVICYGELVTFNAIFMDGGTSPEFEWYVDNELKSSGNLPEFSTPTLANGSVVTCVLISNATCLTAPSATSNAITIVVNPVLPVSIEITSDTNSICQGEEISFSAETANGGTNPTFNWYIDDQIQTEVSSLFVTSDLMDGATIRAEVISSESCTDPEIASSNSIIISVNELLTPTVSITVSENSICEGENVIFTALAVNGGLSPEFEWYINSELVHSGNSNTFSSDTLSNNSMVTCTMTSNQNCLTIPTVSSNSVSISVNPILLVSIEIAASDNIICKGEEVTFSAETINAGTNPIFNWYVDNQIQTETSNQYVATDLIDETSVRAEVISSEACPDPEIVSSNAISITVNELLTPSITISASENSICQDENVIFTASSENSGQNPAYQWYIGNDIQTETSNVFSTSLLNSGDQVYCIVTSDEECLEIPTATSNFISVAVNPLATPSVNISASSTSIFSCEQVVFTPSPSNGGQSPQYKWFVNGNLEGVSATFTTTSLLDESEVHCAMTADIECPSTPIVNSDTIIIEVFPLPSPEIIVSNDTISIGNFSGDQYTYSWYFNGNPISNSEFINCHENGNGAYYVVVSVNNCSVTSATVNITCSTGTNDTIIEDNFVVYPNPTDEMINLVGSNLSSYEYSIEIYNMLGKRLKKMITKSDNDKLNNQFDFGAYPAGIYYFLIKGSNNHKVFSIQKY